MTAAVAVFPGHQVANTSHHLMAYETPPSAGSPGDPPFRARSISARGDGVSRVNCAPSPLPLGAQPAKMPVTVNPHAGQRFPTRPPTGPRMEATRE
jgi:hypothetical protein